MKGMTTHVHTILGQEKKGTSPFRKAKKLRMGTMRALPGIQEYVHYNIPILHAKSPYIFSQHQRDWSRRLNIFRVCISYPVPHFLTDVKLVSSEDPKTTSQVSAGEFLRRVADLSSRSRNPGATRRLFLMVVSTSRVCCVLV